jgi:GDP/UDP-N,N'-diacetylbacillosamine 2-epimerase (hydrolysing)
MQMGELLSALDKLIDCKIIFTMPNADTDGRKIFHLIESFCRRNENAVAFTSLGQIRYLSCLKHVDMVIGNSSSGLAEVPSFKIPTINIGDRQRGRMKANSVIDCEPTEKEINRSILRALSSEFKKICSNVTNPYGSAGASSKIIEKLEHIGNLNLLKKNFYDLPINE